MTWLLPVAAQAQIAFVQRNYSVPQAPQSTVTAAYTAAQTAGNLNVVIVGWNDSTATVTSISDTKGNLYSLAVGPTVRAGQATQSIYFAPNIAAAAAGGNTVTVRFSAAAVFPDVRILEYRGLDPVSPLHATTASSGSSNSSSSGTLAVSVTSALLVAGNTVGTTTGSAGAGFTNRVITSPDGDIAEDRIVSASGSYSATAPLDSSGYWVMQMAAFKPGTGAPNTPPTISNVPAQVTNENAATSTIGFTVGDAETPAANLTVSGASSAQALVPNANIVFGGTGANRTVTITPAQNQFGVTTITLTVSDGSLSTSASFQLTVNAVNQAPTISAIGNQVTTSGIAAGPIAFTVGDLDTPLANLTLSGASSNTTLVPNANIAFGGSGASRTVTVTPVAAQTGAATITVTVSDGLLSTSTGFLLTVNATNTPPTISTIPDQSTIGGTATGAIAFTVGDAETPATSLTLSGSSSNTVLVPNANIVFGGSGANRTVTVTPGPNQFGTSIITVTVSDGLLATSAIFQLTVSDSAPTISAIANQTTTSGTATSPIGFTLADLDTPLANLTLTGTSSNLTLVPVSGIAFGGSGANRTVTVAPVAGQTGTATITVTVGDGTLSASSSFVLTVNPSGGGGTPAVIAFKQVNSSVPQTPQSTVTAAYTAVQTAGDLNVVIVGWSDTTATVSSVTDTKGNAYSLAIGPTLLSGNASQSIYFAPNIAAATAGANTVTVRFSTAAVFPDVRILEYSGLDPANPLLAVSGGTGTSGTSSSGALTVPVGNVLLVAGNVVGTSTSGAGAGFTRRVITSPDGDIAEDQVAAAAGSYTATAPLSSPASWVMQMAAFAGATVGPNTPPTISSVPAQVDTEDTPSGTIAFTVGDAETPAGSLTVSGASSNLTLVPNTNFVFGGSGASRTVTITPAANQSGVTTITLTVSDGTATASTSFQFTVNAVNDPPTISTIANQATTTGSAVGPIAFTVNDVDTPVANLTLSGSSSNTALVPNANVVFGGSGANRTVTLTPAAGQTGSTTITVTVSDGALTASTSFLLSVSSGGGGGTAVIGFGQVAAAVPQTPQSSVTVTYPAAQTAGNLNVVIVGWNDSTAIVTSVTDTKGNAYSLAVGPTSVSGHVQSIYYAPNIAGAVANGNVLTVTFSAAASFPDVRVLEYSGIDPVSPLHAIAAATGNSLTSSSGPLTVSVPNVLLVAANTVATTTGAAGAGFTNRVITSPDGDIAEDRVASTTGSYTATAALDGSGPWVMQMVAFKGAGASGDDTPPTVAVTAPSTGDTVTSTVNVTALASDNVAVAGVQFFLDGLPLGTEVLAAPFSTLWDTTAGAPGSHTLTATAFDTAGNAATSLPVSVTVVAPAPSVTGQWTAPAAWPLVTVHATLLPTGDVLGWDGGAQLGAAYVWRPSTNTFTNPNPPDNIFCAGHVPLADGRLMVVGGHIQNFVGIPDANIFDPTTSTWTQVLSMGFGRWYPSALRLSDSRVLVVAGDDGCDTCRAAIPEVYDVSANSWTQLTGASNALPEYPRLFVLPDGRVLQVGSFEEAIPTQILDVGAQTWTTVDPVVVDGHSAVMYGTTKFMKSGTSATSDPPYKPASGNTYVLDMSQANPTWRATAPMAFPRSFHNLTILPDGSVLATGGGMTTDPFDQTQAVFPTELWSPATETWTTLAPLSVVRLYHSIALLLPDARVLVSGGGRFGGGTQDDQLSAEIFSPPYLFKGARPVISAAPATLSYNTSFSVTTPDAARIATVSLIPLGSVTHHFNYNQRYISLPFQVNGGALTIQTPANANFAPPGYHMLFIVDTAGIPSVAAILRIQ